MISLCALPIFFLLDRWSLSDPRKSLFIREISALSHELQMYFLSTLPFIIFFLVIYLLAVLGLCCCVRAFSSCGERGLLFIVVRGLLVAVAALVAEHGL